jgi:hypothetical protein
LNRKIPTEDTLHELADRLETTFPMWNGLEAAVVGYVDSMGDTGHRLVYSGPKCLREFVRQGMSPQEAREWAEFNLFQAYIGKETPIILWPIPWDILDDTGRTRKQPD